MRVAVAKKAQGRKESDLNALTAEKVFGWKDVHRYAGEFIGKKQDKAGRWRKAKVPPYASDSAHAYAIDERIKQLGRWERYEKELARITKTQNLPREWATPEQRSRAAVKAVGK
jgi:hypothetical protein